MRWWHRTAGERTGLQGAGGEHDDGASPFDNEFDAYLGGTYVDWLAAAGQAIPTWAWLNRIAHASLDQLRSLADADAPADLHNDAALWRVLTGFLANEVLARVADETQLEALQRDALVPLELRLAERWWAPFAPVDVATAVLVALQTA